MAEEQSKEEEKFDFTLEGEALGYISLDQARVLAMRTARETPGDYGRRFRTVSMAFDVVEAEETEDHYVITISFRPQGGFTGTPGHEQFFITKEGAVSVRQVLNPIVLPRRKYRPFILAGAALAGVAAVFVIGTIIFGGGSDGGDGNGVLVAGSAPTVTPSSDNVPALIATQPTSISSGMTRGQAYRVG